jgi:hypothetical protein
VDSEGGVNNVFGDLVLGQGKHSRANTAKPQTTVSRKGAKNVKNAGEEMCFVLMDSVLPSRVLCSV